MTTRHTLDIRIYQLPSCVTFQYLVDQRFCTKFFMKFEVHIKSLKWR